MVQQRRDPVREQVPAMKTPDSDTCRRRRRRARRGRGHRRSHRAADSCRSHGARHRHHARRRRAVRPTRGSTKCSGRSTPAFACPGRRATASASVPIRSCARSKVRRARCSRASAPRSTSCRLLSATATVTRHYVDAVARHDVPHSRHAQDDPGSAPRAEIRGPLRRRHESSHRSVRRDPGEGESHRRGRLDRVRL